MRLIFGVLAIALIGASWVVCPASLRDSVTRSVTPDAETIADMRAGTEVILAALTIQAPDLGEDERNAP